MRRALAAAVALAALACASDAAAQYVTIYAQPNASGVRLTTVLSADFTAATVGPASLPSGLTLARASARFLRTGLSTMGATSGSLTSLGSDIGGIGQVLDDASTRGLWIEPAAVNILSDGRTFSAWTQSGTITTGQTGPDGLASATRYQATNARALLSPAVAKQASGSTGIMWAWLASVSTTTWQGEWYDGNSNLLTPSALPPTWQVLQSVPVPSDQSTQYFILGEALPPSSEQTPTPTQFYQGGGAVQQNPNFATSTTQDFVVWAASFESEATYATTYCDASRAGELLSLDGTLLHGRRFVFEATFTLEWSESQVLLAQSLGAPLPNPTIWYQDAQDYAEIAQDHGGAVRLTVGGVPVVFPVIPPWLYGTPTTLHLEGGNGMARGWYSVGAGRINLGTENATQPVFVGAGTVSLFSRPGPSQQIGGTIQSITLSVYP